MGSYVLPASSRGNSLPPGLPYTWSSNNSINSSIQQNNEGSSISPVVISVIGCLGAAFLIVSYYTMVAKFCRTRRVFGRGRQNENFDDADEQNVMVWPIFARGLHESVVEAIPVCKYSKSDGLVDSSECAVCLSEFEENESLRLLPKCNHAFHLLCIDKWLQSQSNCPLCRASIVSALPLLLSPTAASEQAPIITVEDSAAVASQPFQDRGTATDVGSRSDRRRFEPTADDDQPAIQHSLVTTGDQSASEERAEAETEESGLLKAPSRRNKIYLTITEALQLTGEERKQGFALRCFSTGRALMDLEEGRLQVGYQQECDRAPIPVRRSSSLGTCSVRSDPLRRNQSSSMDLCQGAAAEVLRLLRSSSQTKLNIRLNNAAGSSSNCTPSSSFKSRSLNQGPGLKSKSDINESLMSTSLFSLKGPITVKRSFSGGRLFGFRVKNSAGTLNARLPM